MSVPIIQDPSFEATAVGSISYINFPTGGAWTATTTPGQAFLSNSSDQFQGGFSPNYYNTAPDGSNVACILGQCSISQLVPGWAAGDYQLSLRASLRRAEYSANATPLYIQIDGVTVGSYLPGCDEPFSAYTTPKFTVTAGDHTIAFAGMDDKTAAMFDAISLANVTSTTPTPGTLSVTSSDGVDTLSYTAPTAGSAAIAGVYLYGGSTAGGESSTALAMVSGAAAGSFTNPSGSTFYTMKVVDVNGLYSVASNEVQGAAAPANSGGGLTASQVTTIVQNALGSVLTPTRLAVLDAMASANLDAATWTSFKANEGATTLPASVTTAITSAMSSVLTSSRMGVLDNMASAGLTTQVWENFVQEETATSLPASVSTAIQTALAGMPVETNETLLQTLRILRAVLAGKATDSKGISTFLRADNSTTALSVAHDLLGNRTSSTVGNV